MDQGALPGPLSSRESSVQKAPNSSLLSQSPEIRLLQSVRKSHLRWQEESGSTRKKMLLCRTTRPRRSGLRLLPIRLQIVLVLGILSKEQAASTCHGSGSLDFLFNEARFVLFLCFPLFHWGISTSSQQRGLVRARHFTNHQKKNLFRLTKMKHVVKRGYYNCKSTTSLRYSSLDQPIRLVSILQNHRLLRRILPARKKNRTFFTF